MKSKIFGTKEWASSNENIMFGCQHDCLYCYAKAMSPRHKKIDISRWDEPILRQDKIDKSIGKRKGTIMFPTTHDIHPDNLPEIIPFLGKLLKPGNKVLIVSKPHYHSIQSICDTFENYSDQILFRFTIGSASDDVLNYWEPNAPKFEERLAALAYAFEAGYKTSISMEPMLDLMPSTVIALVWHFVTDSIWLGKMNDAERRIKANGHKESPGMMNCVNYWEQTENIMALYLKFKDDPKIKWKESIKKIVGLEMPTEKGMDV